MNEPSGEQGDLFGNVEDAVHDSIRLPPDILPFRDFENVVNNIGCGDDASAGWRTIVVAAVIQGQVGLETSNNIIEKGLALRPRQSGSVVASTGY